MEDIASWKPFSERLDASKQKNDFSSIGYIRIENFLTQQEIGVIAGNLQRYREEVIPNLPSEKVFYEDKNKQESIIRLEQMHKFDSFFDELAKCAVFNGLIDELLGEACVPDNVQWFSKPPGAKATPPHQDGKYFMHDKAVTLWLALDDVDEETGCLYYVPGSHKKGLIEHYKTDVIGFSQALIEYPEWMAASEQKQPAKCGTLLGHHAYMVHRAGANKSATRWRPALGLTYWAKSIYEDTELMKAKSSYQQSLKETLIENGKI